MLDVKQVTSDFLQTQTVILTDGTFFKFTMNYKPLQYGWFITELTYGDFVLQGLRICVSPNFLYQFRNQIPFGVACFTKDGNEPTQQEDFSSGYAKMYVLEPADMAQLAEFFGG